MNKIKPIAAIILAVLAIVVALQNTAPVETELLFVTVIMPRAVLLFITFLIGFAVGMLFSLILRKKRKSEAKENAS